MRFVWVVCLVVASLLVTSEPAARTRRPALATTSHTTIDSSIRDVSSAAPTTLDGDLLAYAPARATTHPIPIIYMHGAHGRAEKGCPWLRAGAAEIGWLVCPEGVDHDADGATSWGANIVGQGQIIARTLRTTESQGAHAEDAIAVGFSQGAYAAVDLVKFRLARFRGLVLLSADMHPRADTFRANGVARVAFGAGRYDTMHDSLIELTNELVREGIDARFFDLGKVGHTYIAEDPDTLAQAIAWVSASPR
jgi:pimeloyl-ACP methyl ester carboxylesterase